MGCECFGFLERLSESHIPLPATYWGVTWGSIAHETRVPRVHRSKPGLVSIVKTRIPADLTSHGC
eukprot:6489645-Amphidinium_carterae.1